MAQAAAGAAVSNNGADNTNAPAITTGDNASGLFQTLQGHVDSIRSLIQCGVCIRPLYEPYTLACGHTFCYSCLTSWFVGGRHNKTCPDCRAPVKAQPAPAYLVRAVVQMFTSQPELLDKGETTDEHQRHHNEEAERLEKDRQNADPKEGGLFRGTFNKPKISQPIMDDDDNILRCPHCAWELEDDECIHCGYQRDRDSITSTYYSDMEGSEEMTDYMDDDIEDGFGEYDEDYDFDEIYTTLQTLPPDLHDALYRQHPGYWPRDWPAGPSSGIEDSEMDDEDDDADMDSFIDDDLEHEHGDYSESDRSTVVGHHEYSITRSEVPDSGTPDEMLDGSEDGSSEEDEDSHDSEGSENSEDDDDDDDDEPIRPAISSSRRNRVPTYRVPSDSPTPEPEQSTRASRSADAAPRTTSGAFRRTQIPPANSEANAIYIASSSEDEGPIRPTRRTRRERGNC
ncbi:hypothetical protein ASPACDRAFT_39419 [Aspergillus aculeatus ATCC 16872]|uniref:RING-type domain-containing protein n=1 Tax=Aspergillus aculeatus (strain ATCC 16872 / CBS 172.66 / WB 5094) TaxID=690307 RepID=A0A1L9X5T9_ASPA1|nr:uncharacterized protein ASPACDRAFT_39419 [Aspergillus aculeatus ATCC 16872]OJK03800.1 hypothetical protein ASPACDRAFT_39419 [Aspergillus aculeatus ATCC 16872]